MSNMHLNRGHARVLFGSMLACTAMIPVGAMAQAATQPAAQPAPPADGGLAEIIVTAQRRSQSAQDVPIAVTALTPDALKVNRILSVSDLSGLAPGVTVEQSSGGVGVPTFSMRGAVSYGVVAGSDKEVSIYLDGVYISSPRGSIFDLPDISQIEVLRGPQGTLFGRNATAGAVSVNTRDPSGKLGVNAEFTVGNYDQNRERISINLPEASGFSALFSYVHSYKRGDVLNASAGQTWDRTASPGGGITSSPKYLGTTNHDSFFGALKYEPSSDFSTVLKFDYNQAHDTPDANGVVGVNYASPLVGPLVEALITSNNANLALDGKRPDVVNNGFTQPSDQRVFGVSLTSKWRAGDQLTVKNIFAYRNSRVYAADTIDGLSGLTFTPQALVPYATLAAFSQNPGLAYAPPAVQGATIGAYAQGLAGYIGSPFVIIGDTSKATSEQFSDEVTANYSSHLVTLTAGAIWFHSIDRSGGPLGTQDIIEFTPLPGGVIPLGDEGQSYNLATSIAAYTQAEFHVTPKLDLVFGGRVTNDHKSGVFEYGALAAPGVIDFNYNKTTPTYLVSLNYKPANHTLIYAKYSDAFVSGGSTAGLGYAPEFAFSWEAGLKTDWFQRRFRTNLAAFYVTYHNKQVAESTATFPAGTFPNQADIGTFIYPQGGPEHARGFELETTGLITRGVTSGGSVSYTKTTFDDVAPVLVASEGGTFLPTFSPKWTASLYLQYESEPVFQDARLYLRADGNWHSSENLDPNPARDTGTLAGGGIIPPVLILNARASLRGFKIGGMDADISVWGKNLANNRSTNFGLPLGPVISATFQPARTYGLDLNLNF